MRKKPKKVLKHVALWKKYILRRKQNNKKNKDYSRYAIRKYMHIRDICTMHSNVMSNTAGTCMFWSKLKQSSFTSRMRECLFVRWKAVKQDVAWRYPIHIIIDQNYWTCWTNNSMALSAVLNCIAAVTGRDITYEQKMISPNST